MKRLFLLLGMILTLWSCDDTPDADSAWNWGSSIPPWEWVDSNEWALVMQDTAKQIQLYKSYDDKILTLYNEKYNTYVNAQIYTGTSFVTGFLIGDMFILVFVAFMGGIAVTLAIKQ